MKNNDDNRNKILDIFVKSMNFILLSAIVISYLVTNNLTKIAEQNSLLQANVTTQYLELRAKNFKKVDGQDNQLVFELWSHNLDFKGFDVRFTYDNTKYQPSNMETNVISDKINDYFKFEDEFKDSLDMFTAKYTGEGSGLREVLSINTPVTPSEHIINKDNIGTIISSSGEVLLGKMSFHTTDQVPDISSFKLEENDTLSPKSGIKINLDGTNSIEEPERFIFTDQTASQDATLSNIIVSDENRNVYDLSPMFDPKTESYELTINKYIDKLNIDVITNDNKASMKFFKPKRDADNNLQYDSDNTNILYESNDISSGVINEFTLNKLGESDTILTIKVTAEDTITTKNYTLVIHRPYAVIKGNIKTSNAYKKHVAKVKLYNTGTVNWNNYYLSTKGTLNHSYIPTEILSTDSNEDGTYEFKVIPGTYDMLIDKKCYMDNITTNIRSLKNSTINVKTISLDGGDYNKDGIIDLKDFNALKGHYSKNDQDYDINENGVVDLPDFNLIKTKYSKKLEILSNE